jgi:hypothetical protein
LVEHHDGTLEIVDGIKVVEELKAQRQAQHLEQGAAAFEDDDLLEADEEHVELMPADRALFGVFRPIFPGPIPGSSPANPPANPTASLARNLNPPKPTYRRSQPIKD